MSSNTQTGAFIGIIIVLVVLLAIATSNGISAMRALAASQAERIALHKRLHEWQQARIAELQAPHTPEAQ